MLSAVIVILSGLGTYVLLKHPSGEPGTAAVQPVNPDAPEPELELVVRISSK